MGYPTEEEIKELRKLGFVPRDNRALFGPKKEASEGAKKSAEKLKQFHSTTGMSVRGEDVDKKAKGGKVSGKKWIQKAIKKPGALRKSMGVKKSQKIPAGKLAAAAKKPGKMGQRARLAQTLKGLKK